MRNHANVTGCSLKMKVTDTLWWAKRWLGFYRPLCLLPALSTSNNPVNLVNIPQMNKYMYLVERKLLLRKTAPCVTFSPIIFNPRKKFIKLSPKLYSYSRGGQCLLSLGSPALTNLVLSSIEIIECNQHEFVDPYCATLSMCGRYTNKVYWNS